MRIDEWIIKDTISVRTGEEVGEWVWACVLVFVFVLVLCVCVCVCALLSEMCCAMRWEITPPAGEDLAESNETEDNRETFREEQTLHSCNHLFSGSSITGKSSWRKLHDGENHLGRLLWGLDAAPYLRGRSD